MEGAYCVDLLNNTVLPSKIYSPGPDPCTSCTCDNGTPTYCKVITCATPKNCRLVHPHTTCCNFECHENVDGLPALGDSTLPDRVLTFNELTLRFVVIAFTVFISMSLVAFLVHRLKTRKPRGRQSRPLGVEDNRIGYIEGSIRGSIRYLPEYVAYEPPHAALWKPHGYYPAGEAPPPYEEAVAAARAEAALQTHAAIPADTPSLGIVSTVTMPYHRTIPLNLLSGNSHATTTTTTAVIVRSNVHYDTLPQASQTNAMENIRHPSLSRSSPSSLPPSLPPPQQSLPPCQTPAHLELIKSPSYQPSPKTPSGASKHKTTPGGKTSQSGPTASSNHNIYANVPSPVSSTTSFIGATGGSSKERIAYTSHDKHADKSFVHEKPDRHSKSPSYVKYEKCERGLEIKDRKHDYVYITKSQHEGGPSKPDCDRAGAGKHEEKFHSEHAHHGHKKHKKIPHGMNTVQRNLTMPKVSKNGKLVSGKNLHTNNLALEKQYDQILKNSLKQIPSQSNPPPVTNHHSSRSSGTGAKASVSTISSAYASHHSTIPNYFTSPSLPTPCSEAPPISDVIKPPAIYKSSTTPTLLSHLSNSNPILSISLDSNDEDFIDECENCRSDFPSGDLESRMMSDLETMTLQRARPNCYEEFSSASLTLPTHCRVQRPSPMINGQPPVINRFSSILSQSSLSEEDD